MRRPTVIDLFSGAGLFSWAFQSEGFEVIRAIELDHHAATTYATNLGGHIEVGDLRTLRPSGKCDVLVAGPPLPGLFNARH